MRADSPFVPVKTSSSLANLDIAGSPAGLALSVFEAVVAASSAGMAECSDASRYRIEIHFRPSFLSH
jgi:hypothetical protein